MKRYISLLFVFIWVLSACQQEDPELSLSTGQISFRAEGGSASVTVSSNMNWTATGDPWITFSPSSGKKGTSTVNLTVGANTGSSVRKGGVTFTCGTITRTVTITQAQALDQRLIISHNLSVFVVPSLVGNGMSAVVDFGEGEKQNYSAGLKWNYQSAGTHRVVIESAAGTSFSMESIAGISAIDMSGF